MLSLLPFSMPWKTRSTSQSYVPLLASKYRTIKAESDYERSMKLIKFAMGRGFTMELIRRCIDEGVVDADGDVDFVDDDTDD